MTALRIAIAQPTATEDPGRNGRTVRRLMREAAARRARLVQFPEGLLSGYAKEQGDDWDDVDWTAVHDELQRVVELAAELRLWVLLGSAHPLTTPNRPHNSAYVISDEGGLVDRYDKRFCSNTEITRFYTPGFDPVTFDVDGFRFGCALCIEVNFPEVFAEYERLGADCVLLSAYPLDSVFQTKARAHAAIYNYWIGLSTPAQTAHVVRSGLIGPDGDHVVRMGDGADLVVGDLDREAPEFDIALTKARPWRASAREGGIYRSRRVEDPRSSDRTRL